MKLTPEMIEAAADVLRRIKANGLNPASYIAAQSALYAAIAAIDTAGFAIVPREPTKAMHDAGNAADCHSGECGSYAIWPAMIEAALKEPKSD